MKRFHIHIGVDNLEDSIAFYSALFGASPNKTKDDYAKWMLDDPHLNFAISTRVKTRGVDHLGIQVDDAGELSDLRNHMSQANISAHDEGETTCCYAKSEKSWVTDPNGIAWEAYHTMADAQIYSNESTLPADNDTNSACCVPPRTNQDTEQGCC